MLTYIFLIIYLAGVAVAAWLFYRIHKNSDKPLFGPGEQGFIAIGIMLSWLTVLMLIMGAVASFNKLEWDEYPEDMRIED